MLPSRGRLHVFIHSSLALIAAVLCVALCLVGCGQRGESSRPLQVYCGAGMMQPMEELRQLFEKESGSTIQISYAGAGVLMGQLNAEQPCDVFIPGDAKYVEDAARNGWVDPASRVSVALHVPVLVVSRVGSEKVTCLSDLAGPGVRVGLGDPAACAIGKTANNILQRAELADAVSRNVCVRTPTVNQLLVYLTMNQIDAAILWEDLADQPEADGKLRAIPIAPEQNVVGTIAAVRGARSEQPDLADAFVALLTSVRAREIWRKWGFAPCDG